MKKILTTVFFFFALIFSFNQFIVFAVDYSSAQIKDLALCLRNRGFKMYGATNCSACAIEKGYFGENFSYINYINCDENTTLCKSKNIHAYPTWEDGAGKKYKGAATLAILAKVSGCQIDKLITEEEKTKETNRINELLVAFMAGLFSFLAPCLLPLLPSYFAVISGFTFADLYGLDFGKIRWRVFTSAFFFIIGFSFVYTLLGATGSIVGQLIDTYLPFILKAEGVFLIGLGLVQLGVFKFEALQFDFAWKVQRRLTNLGFITAFVTGVASALCWIPCVGPLLTPILILSAKSETVFYGSSLLFIYSLGLTLPFLLAGLFFPAVVYLFQAHRVFFHRLSQMAGLFLVAFGMVLIIDKYRYFIDLFYSFVDFRPTIK